MRNTIRTSSMIILLILITTSCTIHPWDSTEMNPADSEKEQIVLRFSWWGEDVRHERTLAMIDAYEAMNPHMDIQVEYSSFDGYYQRLRTQLVSGTAPDIIQIDQPWIYELSRNKQYFADINTLASSVDITSFDKKFIEDYCMVNGKLLGLPTGINGMTVLMERSMLEGAGLNFEQDLDWEDLIEAGVRFREVYGEDKYLLSQNMDSLYTFIFEPYVKQLCGNQFITDDHELGFEREHLVEGFNYLLRLIDNGVIMSPEDILRSEGYDKVLGVDHAGTMTWLSSLDYAFEGKPEKYLTLRYPIMAGTANTGITVRPSQLIALNGSSVHLDEAADFLEFLMGSQEGVVTLGTVRGVPASNKAQAILTEKGILTPLMADSMEVCLANRGIKPSPMSNSQMVQQMVYDSVREVAFKEVSPEKAADELIELLKEYLAQQ